VVAASNNIGGGRDHPSRVFSPSPSPLTALGGSRADGSSCTLSLDCTDRSSVPGGAGTYNVDLLCEASRDDNAYMGEHQVVIYDVLLTNQKFTDSELDERSAELVEWQRGQGGTPRAAFYQAHRGGRRLVGEIRA